MKLDDSETVHVCKAIYDYFMKYPTKKKLTKIDIPETQCKEEIEEHNRSVIDLWLEDYVSRQTGCGILETVASELFNDYKSFCSKGNYNIGLTAQKFGMKLTTMGIKSRKARVDGVAKQIKEFDLLALKKKYDVL